MSASEVEAWWVEAFEELYARLTACGAAPSGPPGALYSGELFQAERGEVTAFVPSRGALAGAGRAEPREIPGAELAVALHRGSFSDLDKTYGALGTFVAEREVGIERPIREHYLVSARDTPDEAEHRTEVGWPVFRTRAAGSGQRASR